MLQNLSAMLSQTGPGVQMPPVSSGPLLREGEKRFVSVLFADVKGFTSMSEILAPDLVQMLLDQLMLSFSVEVERYGGYVDKYEGDRIMAHFGSKSFLEQNSRRAVYAGLGMIGVITSFNQIRHQIPELEAMPSDLAIRVGINSGMVATGRVGMKREGDFTVYGDAVNLASRMEENGLPMRVLLPETVKSELEDYFEFSFFGEINVKGKAEAVRTWLVDQPLADAGSRRLSSTPFLGREKELKLLREALNPGSRLKLLHLEAEAGMGKTRLLREFVCEDQIDEFAGTDADQQVSVFHLEVSLLARIPYSYFAGLIKSWISITDQQNNDSVIARLNRGLDNLDGLQSDEKSQLISCLMIVLGRAASDQLAWGSLEEQRTAINRSLMNLIRALSASRSKTVLIFDDLHFADEASLHTLAFLIRSFHDLPELPLLFILVARTACFPKDLIPRDIMTPELSLEAFSEAEIKEMILRCLPEIELPLAVTNALISRSAGNPLYLEFWLEGIRAQLKTNAYPQADEISIPDGISSTLLWRLNWLDQPAREQMQRAAVCGDVFAPGLLYELELRFGQSSDPGATLRRAEQLGLICFDGSTCSFRHHLIWEAVYGTILEANRVVLHAEAAAAIERLYPGGLEPYYMRLADHYLAAKAKDKAAHYLIKAESQARSLFMGKRVVACCRKLLKILPPQEQPPVRVRLATQLMDLGQVREAEKELSKLEIDQVSDREEYIHTRLRVLQARQGASVAKSWLLEQKELPGCPALRISLIDLKRLCGDADDLQSEADELQSSMSTPVQRTRLHNTLGLWHKDRGRYQQAQECFEAARSQTADNKPLRRIVLHNLANVLTRTGNRSQALPIYLEAIKLAEELGDEGGLAKLQGDLGGLYLRSGDRELAVRAFQASSMAARMVGDKLVEANALYNLAVAEYDSGRLAEARCWLDKCLSLYRSLKSSTGMVHARDLLGDILYSEGQASQAARVYGINLKAQKRGGDLEGLAHSLGNLANIAADQGNYNKALALYTRQAQILRECKDPEGEGKALYNLAILEDESGKREMAISYLKDALRLFEAADLQTYLPEARAFMNDLTVNEKETREER